MNSSTWFQKLTTQIWSSNFSIEKNKSVDETHLWFWKNNKSFRILDLQWSKKFWQNIIQYNNKVKQPQMTNDFFSYLFFAFFFLLQIEGKQLIWCSLTTVIILQTIFKFNQGKVIHFMHMQFSRWLMHPRLLIRILTC